MRRSLSLLLLASCLLLPVRAHAEQTAIWASARTGLLFYNETDPDPLEQLASELSAQANDPTSTRRIEFEDKGWEIPLQLKLGLRLNSLINVYGLYERLPYVINSTAENSALAEHPGDTVRLDMPSNVWGLGADFRLGTEGYGNSMLLGFAAGRFFVEGDDQDANGFANYTIDGKGLFWEVSFAAEFDFTDEISFYPFVAFQSASTTDVDATYVKPTNILSPPVTPEFEVDYTGLTFGIEVRFRLYPWDDFVDEPIEEEG